MSYKTIFKKGNNGTLTAYEQAIVEIGSILETKKSLIGDKDLVSGLLGLESVSDSTLSSISRPVNEMMSALRGTSLVTLMQDQGYTDDQISAGLEHATYQALTYTSGKKYYSGAESKPSISGDNVELVMASDADVYGLESFDPVSVVNYVPATIVAMAMTRNSKFEDLFFPSLFVPAGSSGYDLDVKMPIIYSTTLRSTNGDKFNIVQNPLVQAVINPSILEGEQTTLIPYADDSKPSVVAKLVAAADIPTRDIMIGSTPVPMRPIKFAQEVDLMGLSSMPALMNNGVYDESDQLDPAINIGTVYWKLVIDDGTGGAGTVTAYYGTDISRQQMSQLNKNPAGKGQDFLTGLDASLVLDNTMDPLNGNTVDEVNAAIAAAYGLTPGHRFTLVNTMVLSANANTEHGSMRVYANALSMTSLFDEQGQRIDPVASIPVGTSIGLTPLGYFPQARRTNSNMRSNGIIVDMHVSYKYRYYLTLSAPIISQTPLNGDNMITLDGLAATARLRTSGRCVAEMLKLEQTLRSVSGLSFAEKLPGERAGVTPTYVPRTVDVLQEVAVLSSRENIPALQGALVSAISLAYNQMIKQSNYVAALEANNLSADSFRLIMVTDNGIAPLLMTAGDLRTFGEQRDYAIASSSNANFYGKIYLSLALKTESDQMHPLSFGRLLETPSLTYQGNFTRNNRITTEVHTVVRAKPYILLPILGVIDVLNLDKLFVTQV